MNPMEAPKGKVREDKALCIVLLLCAHALDACAVRCFLARLLTICRGGGQIATGGRARRRQKALHI
jgi:hypothetical protein